MAQTRENLLVVEKLALEKCEVSGCEKIAKFTVHHLWCDYPSKNVCSLHAGIKQNPEQPVSQQDLLNQIWKEEISEFEAKKSLIEPALLYTFLAHFSDALQSKKGIKISAEDLQKML